MSREPKWFALDLAELSSPCFLFRWFWVGFSHPFTLQSLFATVHAPALLFGRLQFGGEPHPILKEAVVTGTSFMDSE